jgi:DNA-binding CsgD family transcriptional regulator
MGKPSPRLDPDRGAAEEDASPAPLDTEPPRGAGAPERAQQIVRALMDGVDAPPAGERDDVVLEVELDGAHYRLVREPVAPAKELLALSPREREIARLVAEGATNKAIAAVLDISLWTVGTHLRRMYAKLDVHSRGALVARFARLGALDGPLE